MFSTFCIYSRNNVISFKFRLICCSWSFQLALENILVEIVPRNAQITVNLAPVNTQTDGVLVLRDGQVKIVPQVIFPDYLVKLFWWFMRCKASDHRKKCIARNVTPIMNFSCNELYLHSPQEPAKISFYCLYLHLFKFSWP